MNNRPHWIRQAFHLGGVWYLGSNIFLHVRHFLSKFGSDSTKDGPATLLSAYPVHQRQSFPQLLNQRFGRITLWMQVKLIVMLLIAKDCGKEASSSPISLFEVSLIFLSCLIVTCSGSSNKSWSIRYNISCSSCCHPLCFSRIPFVNLVLQRVELLSVLGGIDAKYQNSWNI